jgi:hypothetical protein
MIQNSFIVCPYIHSNQSQQLINNSFNGFKANVITGDILIHLRNLTQVIMKYQKKFLNINTLEYRLQTLREFQDTLHNKLQDTRIRALLVVLIKKVDKGYVDVS